MILGWLFFQIRRIYKYFIHLYEIKKFKIVGKHVYIGANGIFTHRNISIGNDVYIGANAVFQSTFGEIKIGNHIMFGPGVNIHGGNHKINEIGTLMKHTSDKQPGDDGIVVIEDDCWIGANAVILTNVTIGKGSVIGSGAVVTRDVPPYSIYTGVPEKKIRRRFTDEQIIEHEKILKERGLMQ